MKMLNTTTVAGLTVASVTLSVSADNLLLVDLSVSNQVTITATDGLSSADTTFDSFIGFYLAGFFNDGVAGEFTDRDGVGDLSTFGELSDGSPALFSNIGDVGLNVWSFTNSTPMIASGEQAFEGSATWDVTAHIYSTMIGGNLTGEIFANADTDDDLTGDGVYIGTWSRVPAPSSLAILGLGGLAASRRRR